MVQKNKLKRARTRVYANPNKTQLEVDKIENYTQIYIIYVQLNYANNKKYCIYYLFFPKTM